MAQNRWLNTKLPAVIECLHNFFVRGCWKFVKVGKIGTHSSWRVSKEIPTPLGDLTPEPEKAELEPELSSPWSETN